MSNYIVRKNDKVIEELPNKALLYKYFDELMDRSTFCSSAGFFQIHKEGYEVNTYQATDNKGNVVKYDTREQKRLYKRYKIPLDNLN